MNFFNRNILGATALLASSVAFAQPKASKGLDPKPEAPKLEIPTTGVTEQAGVGGNQAYARAGVLELGGSLNFNNSKDAIAFSARPTLGYFIMDNVELSAIASWRYTDIKPGSIENSFSFILEPSVHVPVNESTFVFAGAGVGLAAAKNAGAGVAVGARAGVNVLVGRSGIFTPEINLQYTSNKVIDTPQGRLLAVNSNFGVGAGYTVMW